MYNSQILQIASRKGNVRDDLDLAVAHLRDGDVVAQVPRAALDLDALVQKLLEGAEVEDLIADGLRAVDRILVHHSQRSSCYGIMGGTVKRELAVDRGSIM